MTVYKPKNYQYLKHIRRDATLRCTTCRMVIQLFSYYYRMAGYKYCPECFADGIAAAVAQIGIVP
jgi:hypothetical protein